MKVQEILDHKGGKVVTIRPDATISTAVHRLALERIGALVVSEDGVVDRRHPVRARPDAGAGPGRRRDPGADRRVRDLMTTGVRTCRPDDTVKAVMAEMTRHRFRHMPVVEGGRLAGLISIGDVVKTPARRDGAGDGSAARGLHRRPLSARDRRHDRLQRTFSPVDGRVLVERDLAGEAAIAAALERAGRRAAGWRATPVEARAAPASAAPSTIWWHGATSSPPRSPGRWAGRSPRARARSAAWRSAPATCWRRHPRALADRRPEAKPGFTRFIRREPLGLVFVIAPWNYPYLTAVNSIVPALAAGNVVLLKHSAQTPLCAERFQEAFDAAGLPPGVFQHLHLGHEAALRIVASGAAQLVAFTGSVPAGHAVQAAAGQAFIATNLELGGKDPAYVREDADLDHAVENLVDGACFNSGQSCCGIERIYVHRSRFDAFVAGYAALAAKYVLGDPTEPAHQPRPDGPAGGRRFRPRPGRRGGGPRRARPDRPRRLRARARAGRPTWRRNAWSASPTRCASCARRASRPSSASCRWPATTRPWR